MSSLVIELQADCLNAGAGVSDLLRKALVIARKLNVLELDAWIENELNGYRDRESVPQYRVVRTEVAAQDHWERWIPVVFQDSKTWEMVSTVPLYDSVAEMEALLENSARENVGRLTIPFAPEQAELLMRGSQNRLMPTRFARLEDLRGVLDAVRTQILTWCLKLEKDGILGENMTFSKEERQKAAEGHYTTHFHIGTMTHSQIQHATEASSQILEINAFSPEAASHILSELRAHIDEIGLPAGQRKQIEAECTTIETQMSAPTLNQGAVREAFRSIRNVLEGTAGSLIASGLIYEIGRLIG